MVRDARLEERRGRYWRGAVSEWIAAVWLMGKGYRILARRFRTPVGEIDLIAVKGRLLAFVEVKARGDIEAAESSVSNRQRERVRQAANMWLARRAMFQDYEIRFDLVFVVPGAWPRHIVDGL